VRLGSGACRHDQLAGRLDKWWKPIPGAGGGGPMGGRVQAPLAEREAAGGHLMGEVDIHNTSGRDCTLQGEVDVRLYSGGAEVPIQYSHHTNDEARQRVVAVPAGGAATLRVDWTGPYCGSAGPPYELLINLPNGGGELRAPVAPADTPTCSHSETHPEITSFLSSGGFSSPAVTDPESEMDSPLRALKASVAGPATGRPGERLAYTVTLTNPGDQPVSLLPCPGYLQEVHSEGDSSAPGFSGSQLYRLNCRPADHIQPHGELRFEMVVSVPGELRPGRTVHVTWRAVTRQRLPSEALVGVFALQVT
jgi:hypothetical protein